MRILPGRILGVDMQAQGLGESEKVIVITCRFHEKCYVSHGCVADSSGSVRVPKKQEKAGWITGFCTSNFSFKHPFILARPL